MVNNVSFKGLNIGQCEGIANKGENTVIKFFKLNPEEDFELIKRMSQKTIPVRNCYSDSVYTSASKFYKDALDGTKTLDVFLATSDNVPCGLLSGCNRSDSSYIYNFVTWAKQGAEGQMSKIKNTGKGLLNTFFNHAMKENSTEIILESSTYGKNFYENNGFENIPKSDFYMIFDIEKIFKKIAKDINMTFSPKETKVDLSNLDLRY